MKPGIIRDGEAVPAKLYGGPDLGEISQCLARLFANEPTNLGGVDEASWLGESRMNNRNTLRQRTEQILRERKVGEVGELSPNLATQILELAEDDSRPELIELWARLLANMLDRSRNNVRRSYIETIKQMDPQDAILIRRIIHKGYDAISDEVEPAALNEASIPRLATELDLSEDAVIVSLEHLEDLGILASRSSGSLWSTTSFGREFFRACYRYRPGRL